MNNFYSPYMGYSGDIIKVNGRGGAEAFQMRPHSSVILLDTTNPLVWLKTTDGAGYATVTPFEIKPYEEPKPVNMNDINERLARMEAYIYGQSHPANASAAEYEPVKQCSVTSEADHE